MITWMIWIPTSLHCQIKFSEPPWFLEAGSRMPEGGRRKAGGGRRKSEGRRQKVEVRRQKAEGGRRKVEGRRWKAEGNVGNNKVYQCQVKCDVLVKPP